MSKFLPSTSQIVTVAWTLAAVALLSRVAMTRKLLLGESSSMGA